MWLCLKMINFSSSVSDSLFLIISRLSQVNFLSERCFLLQYTQHQQADSYGDTTMLKTVTWNMNPDPGPVPLDQQLPRHIPSCRWSVISPLCFSSTVPAVVWADVFVNMCIYHTFYTMTPLAFAPGFLLWPLTLSNDSARSLNQNAFV